MKSKALLVGQIFLALMVQFCLYATSMAARTSIINPSAKADKATAELMAQTKDVGVETMVKMAELFVSPQEYESLIKDAKKAKGLKIDTILHGDDFFYMQTGPIKVVFKWIDKNNIAYKINGHSFTYEEAAKTELWQKKITQIVKNYRSTRSDNRKTNFEKMSSNLFEPKTSKFLVSLGSNFTSMLVLPFLFQATPAHAFLNNILSNPWALTAIAAVVIVLVANHYYKKHKEIHEENKDEVISRLNIARSNLDAARARGEQNLSAYEKEVIDLENLTLEYGSSDVGFFGFVLGNRDQKPASYDLIMSRPTNGGSGTGVGTPVAPPSSTSGSSSGAF